MNLYQQYETLGNKKIAYKEGVDLLTQMRGELHSTRASANVWGLIGIMSNVVIIPLNVVINSYQLKGATSLYQEFARRLYAVSGSSGSQGDGAVITGISALRGAINSELSTKAMSKYIPGVNVLLGFTQDAIALWQTVKMVEAGSREINAQVAATERKINDAIRLLILTEHEHSRLLDRMGTHMRTA